MHRLDDRTLITPLLLRRFQAEAELDGGDGQHFAILQRDGGDLLHHDRGPTPPVEQLMVAHDLIDVLNRQLHHDGAWVMVFTHLQPAPVVLIGETPRRYGRLVVLWLDENGDPSCPVEIEDSWEDVMLSGCAYWAEQCEQAWSVWKLMMRDVLNPKPEQQFARAQGERPPSTVH